MLGFCEQLHKGTGPNFTELLKQMILGVHVSNVLTIYLIYNLL